MSHFRFIEKDIDVSYILKDIKDDDWAVAGSLRGAAGDTQPYGFLPLTMAMVRHADDDPKKTELQMNTPMFKTYKGIRRWLKSFFWFDNKKIHESYNNSNVDRLTFVFDVPKGKNNP